MTYAGLIVLGPPRSGTTLLRRLLDAHPKISCPPETNVFCGIGRFMREDRFVDGGTLGVVSGLAYAGLSPNESVPMLREFAFSLHRAIAQKQGKPIWAAKTAVDAFYVDEIEILCGEECRFICVTRNGMDVACSVQELCVKQEAYLPEYYEYIRRCPFPLEAFATMWCELTTRIASFAKCHPGNTLAIKYEDLVFDPKGTMERVFHFAGVEPDPALVDAALATPGNVGPGDFKTYQKKSIDSSSIDRWKSLSVDTRSRLGAIMNPLLEAFGYDSVPVVAPPSPEDVRRRYQMGLVLQSMKKQVE